MKILATKKVIDGSQINILHKENDMWVLISYDEWENGASYDENSLVVIDEEYLYERIPSLRGTLTHPNHTTINIDYSTGSVHVNPKHFHFGIPTHDAKATRQVNVGFQLLFYLKNAWPRHKRMMYIVLACVLLGFFLGWFFYIPAFLLICYKVLELAKIRDMYYSGSLNPGILVDEESSLVASMTDMSLGWGSYPIIRFAKYPVPKAYRKKGTKIPVAGVYYNTEDYSHWNYYEGHPLPTGISDRSIIEEKIRAIPTTEWIALRNEIDKFKELPKPGYYPIKIEETDWKDIDLDQVKWMDA